MDRTLPAQRLCGPSALGAPSSSRHPSRSPLVLGLRPPSAHRKYTRSPSLAPRRLPSRSAVVLGRANECDGTCVDKETDICSSRIGRRRAMSGPPYDLASVWKTLPRPASLLSSDHQSIAEQPSVCARRPASSPFRPVRPRRGLDGSPRRPITPSAPPSHRRAARSSCPALLCQTFVNARPRSSRCSLTQT